MTKLEREEQILKTLLKNEESNARVLVMTDRDEELGTVAVALRGRTLVILEFALTNDCDFDNLSTEEHFYVDTLMRSAASYGETNGADYLETENAKYNKFLSKKGFKVDETHAFAPMSIIVHYT